MEWPTFPEDPIYPGWNAPYSQRHQSPIYNVRRHRLRLKVSYSQTNTTWYIHNSFFQPHSIFQTIRLTSTKHLKSVHQFPNGAGHYTMIVRIFKERLLGPAVFQKYSVQPIVRTAVRRLNNKLNIRNTRKELTIPFCCLTFIGNVPVKILHLGTTQCGVDIRHTVIVAI